MSHFTNELRLWGDGAFIQQTWVWKARSAEGARKLVEKERRRAERDFDAVETAELQPLENYSERHPYLAWRESLSSLSSDEQLQAQHFDPSTNRGVLLDTVDDEGEHLAPMSDDDFWTLFAGLPDSDVRQSVALVADRIRALDSDDVKRFAERLAERLSALDVTNVARIWDLQRVGADGFLYARAWAVLGGLERYSRAPAKPLPPNDEVFEAELLLSVADDELQSRGEIDGHYETVNSFETGLNESATKNPSEIELFAMRIGSRDRDSNFALSIFGFYSRERRVAENSLQVTELFATLFPDETIVANLIANRSFGVELNSFPIWTRRFDGVSVGSKPFV